MRSLRLFLFLFLGWCLPAQEVLWQRTDLPNAVSTTGQLIAAQWLAFEPLSGQFAFSPRHEFRLHRSGGHGR